MAALRRAFVGVGSNDSASTNIAAGLAALQRQFGDVSCSETYESAPSDGLGAVYLNLVVEFRTALNWSQLRAQLKTIEDQCGRRRGDANILGTVSLDLDLLILGACDGVADEYDLPLPELIKASYVLAPLAQLLPLWRHPQAALSLAQLWAANSAVALPLTPVAGKTRKAVPLS